MLTPDIYEIQQLKYRYFRALDTHNWELFATCFTEDCVASYADGAMSFSGRDNIVASIRGSMDSPWKLTMHHGHHPEITVLSETEAEGIWYLHDRVICEEENWLLEGNAFYQDRYRKEDGVWKLSAIGYQRVFETKIPVPADLEITENMFRK